MARTLNTDNAGSAAPKPGHNMPPELIQTWFTRVVKLDEDYKATNEEAKKAKSTLAAEYKLFKDAGGNVRVLKTLVKERNEDRSQVALDKQAEEAYREALNMVIQGGGDLFDLADARAAARTNDSADAEHARLDSAKDKGYAAAKAGKTRDENPHPFESDEWDSWNNGWDGYAMEAVSGTKKGKPAGGRKAKGANGASAAAH